MFGKMDKGLGGESFPGFTSEVSAVACDRIDIPQNRARKIDPAKVDELVDELRNHGKLLQPIGIHRIPGQKSVLIWGAHRLLAWQQLFQEDPGRWHEIPCNCFNGEMTPENAEYMELAENLVRAELSSDQRKKLAGRFGELMPKWRKGSNYKKAKNETCKKAKNVNWIKDWCAGAGRELKTGYNWWNEAKAAGVVSCTPSKATQEDRDAFFAWLKDRESKQAAEHAEKMKREKLEADSGRLVAIMRDFRAEYGEMACTDVMRKAGW
jgi:hypothetical protein